jgi:hypothetical protein
MEPGRDREVKRVEGGRGHVDQCMGRTALGFFGLSYPRWLTESPDDGGAHQARILCSGSERSNPVLPCLLLQRETLGTSLDNLQSSPI